MFIGTLLYGLFNSAVLLVFALGFNLTFGISGIANFAYGGLYILTGTGVWLLIKPLSLPLYLAIPSMIVVTSLVGFLIYNVVLIRVRGMEMSEVIATFGLGMVFLELFRYFGFGLSYKYTLPVFIKGSILIGPVYMDLQRIAVMALGVFLTVGLWVFIHRTRIGLAFRGIAQDERTALCFGIDSDRVASLSMAVGGGLCATAAIMILPLGTISVAEGYDVMLQALSVCIVGGLGSSVGVVVASLILGMARTFTAMYVASHWTMIVTMLAILTILVIKPSGLFGRQKELEERV